MSKDKYLVTIDDVFSEESWFVAIGDDLKAKIVSDARKFLTDNARTMSRDDHRWAFAQQIIRGEVVFSYKVSSTYKLVYQDA